MQDAVALEWASSFWEPMKFIGVKVKILKTPKETETETELIFGCHNNT